MFWYIKLYIHFSAKENRKAKTGHVQSSAYPQDLPSLGMKQRTPINYIYISGTFGVLDFTDVNSLVQKWNILGEKVGENAYFKLGNNIYVAYIQTAVYIFV